MHFNLSSLCYNCSKRVLLYVVISVSSIWIQSIVKGQGRMLLPPSRASMWRFGYDTPVNHNDNVLNCGGTVVSNLLFFDEWTFPSLSFG